MCADAPTMVQLLCAIYVVIHSGCKRGLWHSKLSHSGKSRDIQGGSYDWLAMV